MPNLLELQKRLKELEAEITEAERRLPAHSVKPPVMHILLDLEDEYDRVMKQIDTIKKNAPGGKDG